MEGTIAWLHDQTLKAIVSGLIPYVDEANNNRPSTSQSQSFSPTIAFQTADGTKYRNPVLPYRKPKETDILKNASDWKLLVDEEHSQIVFPPEIVETAKRPDITIFSTQTKNVIIIELTVPAEENLANAFARKKCKYQDLVAECENNGWSVNYFPVEVGSRGIYSTTISKCLASLGIPSGKRKPILDTAAKTALRASYIIWLCRSTKAFRQAELIPPPTICHEGKGTVERSQNRFNPPKSGPQPRDLRA